MFLQHASTNFFFLLDSGRAFRVEEWQRDGGLALIHYRLRNIFNAIAHVSARMVPNVSFSHLPVSYHLAPLDIVVFHVKTIHGCPTLRNTEAMTSAI